METSYLIGLATPLIQKLAFLASLAKRKSIAVELAELERLFLLYPGSLTQDQREIKSGHRTINGQPKQLSRDQKNFRLEFRDFGYVGDFTLREAARFVKLSPDSLRQYVSSRGVYRIDMEPPEHFGVMDILSVFKLNSDGTAKFVKPDLIFTLA